MGQKFVTESKQDPRFKTAHKEAWIGIALAIFNFVWWYGFAYGLGSRPVEEYTYILGLPDWFFWSCVIGFLLMSIITVVLSKFVLTDMPLDDDPTYNPATRNVSEQSNHIQKNGADNSSQPDSLFQSTNGKHTGKGPES